MDDSKKHEVLTKMALYTRDNRNSTPPSMQATLTNAQRTGLYGTALLHPPWSNNHN